MVNSFIKLIGILFFDSRIFYPAFTLTENQRKKDFSRLCSISFCYTTFCVRLLDLTTIYGIIDRHEKMCSHNILCLSREEMHKILFELGKIREVGTVR